MDAPDGLVGETLSLEFCAQQSAILPKMGLELLDVPGGQLVQLDTAQGGGDVVVDPPLIGHRGGRTGTSYRGVVGPLI